MDPEPENENAPDPEIEREAEDAPEPEREASEAEEPDEGEFGAQLAQQQAASTGHPVRPNHRRRM